MIGGRWDFFFVTTTKVLDWDYMQESIAELEQYLVTTNLNDHTLTDKNLKTLFLVSGVTKLEIGWLLLSGKKKKEHFIQKYFDFGMRVLKKI